MDDDENIEFKHKYFGIAKFKYSQKCLILALRENKLPQNCFTVSLLHS